jgi:hypothetical protein
MIGFLILLFVMIAIWVILLGSADVSEISRNWPKYRCQPTIMPFASFFGHDITENFQFCLQGILNNEVSPIVSPIYQILATFLGTIGGLMSVANSLRLEMATFVGGVNGLFQNFTDRFKQIIFRAQTTANRMRVMMARLYGTMFTLIFLTLSAQTSLFNFSDTFLFKFLDTFCFNPDTRVEIQGKGTIPVKDVQIGDRFSQTGARVTSTFSFEADGQPMVRLPGGIEVSTNHYVRYGKAFVRADEHPDAVPISGWQGGSERPLICFNTSTHEIPIGNYTFLDYDETDVADVPTMEWVDTTLNNRKESKSYAYRYDSCFHPQTRVRMKSGVCIPASAVRLGSQTQMGKVMGIVKKEVSSSCRLPTGECVSPGLLVWHKDKWIRAGDLYPIQAFSTPQIFMNCIVANSACMETASGTVIRDYFELHSPDTEQFYAKAIQDASRVITEGE